MTGWFAGGKKRFGSVQSALGTPEQDGSGAPEMKLTSSACSVVIGALACALPGLILPLAMSWRTSFGVIRHSAPPGRTHVGLGLGSSVPACSAFFAALEISPAMPAASPTALEEQLELGIATVTLLAKFVQPLNSTYDFCVGVKVSSYFTTEFVTIVWGSDEGQLWCWAASSAADAITATPWSYA